MFATRKEIAKKKSRRPEVLTHPNIPKPLHGLNPRTILGKEWWDSVRYKAQEDYNYCCAACGVSKEEAKGFQWLEGHEYWNIDHMSGICEVEEIVPLCHYCHNFIHSGRLSHLVYSGKKSKPEAIEILEHGFKILHDNKLKCFPGTLVLAHKLNAKTFNVKAYKLHVNPKLVWDDYKLKLEGKLYDSLFTDSYASWKKHYE